MYNQDDAKLVLHNSAIVINNCSPADFPTLYNRFTTYDPLRHKRHPLGVYYDEKNNRLFFPRGIDVDYLRMKLNSVVGDYTSYVVHNNSYRKIKPIKMKHPPRDDVQKEALKFVLCKDQYQKYSGRSQFGINLNTGKGKTYICIGIISYVGAAAMIITDQTGLLEQWRFAFHEHSTIDDSEIVNLDSYAITRILNGTSMNATKSVYLCTHQTLQSYASKYGIDKISELFKKLGIGIKMYDEAHKCFDNMSLIDFAARDVWRTYYITATPARSDTQENYIYKLYMKNVPSIELFNPEVDPHTGYIALKYNSNPRPSDVAGCKTNVYGLSNPAYVDYIIKNERFWTMFDYVFGLIYRAGGRALFYIATNAGIAKVKQRILMNYPELYDHIGVYSSLSPNKQYEKTKRYILTTTKSAGAGEDIHDLKYSVVLAEPFKSEVLARQTLGRTRDPNTTYIELVDVGFRQLVSYFNAKRPIFEKYASSTKLMNVDNLKLVNIEEDNRVHLRKRFNMFFINNIGREELMIFSDRTNSPLMYFADGQGD